MAASDHGHGEDLAAKDRRIDDLIAEAAANLESLQAIVEEMKRQARKQQSEAEHRG